MPNRACRQHCGVGRTTRLPTPHLYQTTALASTKAASSPCARARNAPQYSIARFTSRTNGRRRAYGSPWDAPGSPPSTKKWGTWRTPPRRICPETSLHAAAAAAAAVRVSGQCGHRKASHASAVLRKSHPCANCARCKSQELLVLTSSKRHATGEQHATLHMIA